MAGRWLTASRAAKRRLDAEYGFDVTHYKDPVRMNDLILLYSDMVTTGPKAGEGW